MKINNSLSLKHFSSRPAESTIDTIVIHSIHAPNSQDPFSIQECYALLEANEVSSHYLISREGEIHLLVPENHRAWHAGKSKMPYPDDSREDVNNFSIGIELIGSETSGFTEPQYKALLELISEISLRYSICAIVGHDHIAPDRKSDPGKLFEWEKIKKHIPIIGKIAV